MTASSLFPRLAYANARIRDLEAELARVRDECSAKVREAREGAKTETDFARELVRAAMLKSGMWPARPTPQSAPGDGPPLPERPAVEPLWQAQARARAEEDAEYERAMANATTAPTEGAPS